MTRSRHTLIARQLVKQAEADTDPGRRPSEYSVDELAQVAGTTVRNIRAYQDRGLLPPPERRGRAGVYTDIHLARLKLVGQLLERGYTLGNIKEMLHAWESGQDLRELLGLEFALTGTWSDELPGYLDPVALLQLFPTDMEGDTLQKAVELELLVPEGQRFRVPSPRLLKAGSELVKAGIPLADLLDILAGLRDNVEHVADEITRRAARIFDRYGDELPPPDAVPRLADLVWRLRPLAMVAVEAEVERAMEKATRTYLSERVSRVFSQWLAHQDEAAGPVDNGQGPG